MGFVYAAKAGFTPGNTFIFCGQQVDGSSTVMRFDTDEYSWAGNSWQARANSPSNSGQTFATAAKVGLYAYLIGGGNITLTAYLNTVDRYSVDTFTTMTNMTPPSRMGLSGVTIASKVYVFAGWDGSVLQDCDEYDPASGVGGTWANKTSMPSPARQKGAAVAIGNNGFHFGGIDGSTTEYADNDEYSQSGDSWSTNADLGAARAVLAATALGGKALLFGGNTGSRVATAEEYDPTGDSYTALEPLPAARENLGATTMQGKAYLSGGRISSGDTRSMIEYDRVGDVYAVKSDMPEPTREMHATTEL